MVEEIRSAHASDEIDLRELFVAMWKKRYVALLIGLLGLFLGAGVFLMRSAGPLTDVYSMDVRFSFKGASSGQYPNGATFRLNDLIASDVVELLYSSNSAFGSSGVSIEDLVSGLSLAPINPNRAFIDAKYKGQLANSKLSATEIDELNTRYKAELEADTGRYARITYTAPALGGESAAVIQNMLLSLPRIWAEHSIKSKGVLALDVVVPPQVDQYILDNSEFVVIADYLRGYASKLMDTAKSVVADDIAALVVDPSSGVDAGSVVNQLNDLNAYHLNVLSRIFAIEPITKSKNDTNLYLKSRIAEVDEALDELSRKADIVSEVYDDYVRSSSSAPGNQIADTQGSGSYSPQYGDGFLTKLMTIGDELSDAKFKQDLLNRRIEFNLSAQELKTERKRLSDALNALNALNALSPLAAAAGDGSKSSKESAQESVIQQSEYIVRRLNELSSVMSGIINSREQILLGNTGSLYEVSTAPAKASNFRPMLISGVKFGGIGLVAGLMLGLMLALVLGALSRKVD